MFKTQFIQSAVDAEALKFGSFTLKSGRQSPYFFNLGKFNTGAVLSKLADAYARTIIDSGIDFDVLFGPAYKGIPLAALTVAKIAEIDPQRGNVEYSFNRKEAKDHGEGGNIVGGSLSGRKVLVIDDVMTAGTAINEAADIIKSNNGSLAGIVIALDRQERMGENTESTASLVSKRFGVPVISIVSLEDIIEILKPTLSELELKSLLDYRAQYGATSA